MSAKIYTIEEIKAIYKNESPRYICLRNGSGMVECTWNNSKVPVNDKFNEIIRTLNKKTIPPGIYYYIQKSSMSKNKNTAEHSFPVGVGNYSLSDQPVIIPPSPQPVNEVWTASKALDILTEKTRLEFELKQANQKIQDLEKIIQEYESESLDDDEPDSNPGTFLSSLQTIITTLSPTIDRFLDQREKQIQLMANGNHKQEPQMITRRSDGGLMPLDPEYSDYLDKVMNSNDDEAIETELNFLEKNYPDLYSKVVKAYNIEDDEPSE